MCIFTQGGVMPTTQPSPRNTPKSSAKKGFVNTVKKDNSQRTVKKVARQFSKLLDDLADPRTREKRIDYPLSEIVFTALVAVICGATSYQDFATFGNEQLKWLKKFFSFDNGIPSHDTFRRVFELLDPNSLENVYRLFIENLKIRTTKHIAIDGKVSRGCYNIKGQCLLNSVSAFDTENGISLGQIATRDDEGKDVGEYNTIPLVIKALDVTDAVVTIDAAGCYTEIVDAIVEGNGHYVITVKDNQPTLMNAAKEAFSEVESKLPEEVKSYQTLDTGHGRIETRTYYAIPVPEDSELRKKWRHLESFVMKISYRTTKGKTSREVHYAISDLPADQIARIAQSFRSHWGIENKLHWVLDVSLGEDDNRTRRGNGAKNLGILRRLALSLIRQVQGDQSVPKVMWRAALSSEYRTTIIEKIIKGKI
jgi:predicted transposase YbfD/YdcC